VSEGFLEDILDKRITITAKIRQLDVEAEHRAKLVDVSPPPCFHLSCSLSASSETNLCICDL
jgi:hypothetical protein